MNYAVELRFRLVDFLLYQYGYVSRSALVEYFGISEPQATRDMREYLALAPQNATYDLSSRTYVRGEKFEKAW